ncbi:MaoC/PaaZ C-terminal domain-containing protein [Dehalobacterium formicoaceticum]|uniref:MaoC/PaaZ C-terminal domain-containing protein n=1 Tax=Dehalobacterium formicoaceticum TaxID=51515 RepID=UPI000B7E16F5|nr:MaoC/PaaZ C-terminal domain-containing protein [Dehalobacterium formicoaceticum]
MYFEDLIIGQKFSLGEITLTEEEIHRFAEEFDPLPIHVDPEFAKESIYGGIIASGFHTLCVLYGKWVKTKMISGEIIGGLGFDYLKWTAPVRANDILHGEWEIVDKIPSSKKGRGIFGMKITAWNQENQMVITCQIKALIKSRS